jgi:energy-coupling factor transport system ATP-binding protein
VTTGPATLVAALVVSELRVQYPGRAEAALDGVRFDVRAGEVIGLAGRTGAGKSTLALAAAGFIPRVIRARISGRVDLDGLSAPTASAAELGGRVGIVFSTPANQLSASKLTVRDELAFGLENLAVPRSAMDARIDAVLDRLSISHLADREPLALSGGEQQRVAIASIVAMGTSLVVLDEPTAELDPDGTAIVAGMLADLASSGVATLVAEHAGEVLARTERVVLLDRGRVVVEDEPGAALRPAALAPTGLRPPTLVALAATAGLPPDASFDEPRIAAALAASDVPPAPSPPSRPVPIAWEAVRGERPVVVEVRNLSYGYPGGVEAVRGASLEIGPGESVAIVGRNGSGKTTLVRHLNGLLRPTSGDVLLDGRSIAARPVHEIARSIGLVFQQPDDQIFNRSVEREVAFGPRQLGLGDASVRRLVDQAIAVVGLDAERTMNPYDLGPSLRKLVALAGVLAMEPAVLMLDEPTSGQDGPGIDRVGTIVDGWRASGRTVIAISHDIEFAAAHFGRIIVMRDGEIVADGPPDQVLSHAQGALLASTGLVVPPAARIAARLGVEGVPRDAMDLLARLRQARPAQDGAVRT